MSGFHLDTFSGNCVSIPVIRLNCRGAEGANVQVVLLVQVCPELASLFLLGFSSACLATYSV